MSPIDVVRAFNAAWNAHDLEAVLALVSDDCVYDSSRSATPAGRIVGRDALRAAWSPGFAAPSGTFSFDEPIGSDQHVAQPWTYERPNGPPVRGVDLFRVEAGLLAEKSGYVKVG
ncbi:MAG TPA: nuclear transport factor 2 family protein [Ilumatobacter sp.]|nr:nuclear transport factor 2 family protein [Ilumatobacter sp.]